MKTKLLSIVTALLLASCNNPKPKNATENTAETSTQESQNQSIKIDESKFYSLTPHYVSEDKKDFRNAFISISETYNEYLEKNHLLEKNTTILNPVDFQKDTIQITGEARQKLLERTGISENDQIFIYNILKNKVKTFKVNDLKTTAVINIYMEWEENRDESFYELGFDLGRLSGFEENIVYIGKENPFNEGKLRRLNFDTTLEKVPFTLNEKLISAQGIDLKNAKITGTYKAVDNLYDIYIQDFIIEKLESYEGSFRYVVVLDKKSQKIIREIPITAMDGTELTPVTKENSEFYPLFVGELIKGKSDILLGFDTQPCHHIHFVNHQKPIRILCDNRH